MASAREHSIRVTGRSTGAPPTSPAASDDSQVRCVL